MDHRIFNVRMYVIILMRTWIPGGGGGWAHRQWVYTTFLTRKNSHKLFWCAPDNLGVFGPGVRRSTRWATQSPSLHLVFLGGGDPNSHWEKFPLGEIPSGTTKCKNQTKNSTFARMETPNRSLHKWHLEKLYTYLLFYICLSVRTLLRWRQNLPKICTLFCLVLIE